MYVFYPAQQNDYSPLIRLVVREKTVRISWLDGREVSRLEKLFGMSCSMKAQTSDVNMYMDLRTPNVSTVNLQHGRCCRKFDLPKRVQPTHVQVKLEDGQIRINLLENAILAYAFFVVPSQRNVGKAYSMGLYDKQGFRGDIVPVDLQKCVA